MYFIYNKAPITLFRALSVWWCIYILKIYKQLEYSAIVVVVNFIPKRNEDIHEQGHNIYKSIPIVNSVGGHNID